MFTDIYMYTRTGASQLALSAAAPGLSEWVAVKVTALTRILLNFNHRRWILKVSSGQRTRPSYFPRTKTQSRTLCPCL